MVKKSGFVFLLFALVFFSTNLVSAYGDLGYYLDRAAYQVQPVAQFFLGGYDYTGYMLFERFLFFMIIFSISFVVLKTIPTFKDQKPVVIVISLAVPLLAIRYLSFTWINTVILSYQVLGVAITGILPFIIYLFFLHGVSTNTTVRKIGWIFFICVYLGLYSTAEDQFYGSVYLWTMLLALVFLFFDGTIQRAIVMNRARESGKSSIWDIIRERTDEKMKWLNTPGIDQKVRDKRVAEIDKELKKLYKMVS